METSEPKPGPMSGLKSGRLKGDVVLKVVVGAAAVGIVILLLALAYELTVRSELALGVRALFPVGTRLGPGP